MKRGKRITAFLGALLMAAALTACGSQGTGDGSSTGGAQQDTLVAYFSYSGNTEAVAQQIADYTGGTLVEIQRSTPYDDVNAEGEEELNSNARPEITVDLESIEEYDTVFIGYPKMEQGYICV